MTADQINLHEEKVHSSDPVTNTLLLSGQIKEEKKRRAESEGRDHVGHTKGNKLVAGYCGPQDSANREEFLPAELLSFSQEGLS